MLLGDQADVEERHHLAELHRRALHRAQRGDDLLGRLEVALLERLGALVGRATFAACVPPGARPGRPRVGRSARCARGGRSDPPWPSATGWRRATAPPRGRRGRRRPASAADRDRAAAGVGGPRHGAAVDGGVGVGVALPSCGVSSRSPSCSAVASSFAGFAFGRRTGSCGGRWRPSRRTSSSDAVTTPTAIRRARSARDQRDLQPRAGLAPSQAVRVIVARDGASSRRCSGAARAPPASPRRRTAGSRVRRGRGLEAARAAPCRAARHARRDRITCWTGLRSPSDDERDDHGVIAVGEDLAVLPEHGMDAAAAAARRRSTGSGREPLPLLLG